MSVILTINGQSFDYPQTGDQNWGVDSSEWAQAVTSGMLQKAGGLFQLLSEVDFGTSHGIKSLYIKSRSANVAQSGVLRLANADSIVFRNDNNTSDLALGVNTSNLLTFNGSLVSAIHSISDSTTIDLFLTGTDLSASIIAASITNTYISASAAIDRSKLASGSNYRVLVNNGSGVMSEASAITASRALVSDANGLPTHSSVTSTELGHVSGVTSSIQTQLNAKFNKAGDTMSGTLNMGSNAIINLPEPSNPQDPATKNYVDSLAQGIDAKQSVRAATTASGTLASSFANGQSIDGVTLATGNRILIKNQSDAKENGIYIVQASGAPVRSTDADVWSELVGAFTFVEEGTTLAETGWVCSVNAGGTIGSNNIDFVQFSSAGIILAGSGLTKTGNTLSVNVDNSTIEINSNNLQLKDSGITNAKISASAAISLSKLATVTASRALVSDASGFVSASSVTSTELGYVAGVTSSIQSQLDAKFPILDAAVSSNVINWNNSTTYISVTSNTTFTYSNASNGKTVSLVVTNTGGSLITLTFPAGFKKRVDFTANVKAGKANVYTFIQSNGNVYVACVPDME